MLLFNTTLTSFHISCTIQNCRIQIWFRNSPVDPVHYQIRCRWGTSVTIEPFAMSGKTLYYCAAGYML